MNYITPTFNFQPGDELCFNIPAFPNPAITHHVIHDMLVEPMVVEDEYIIPITQPEKTAAPAATHDGDEKNHRSSKKKITHRDVERQRRHEMAMLYAALRSQLPTEYLKGKRSISDHMNEAAKYIKHQQEKIRRLTERRDSLRRAIPSSPSNSTSSRMEGSLPSLHVTVQPCFGGVEVVISSGPEDEVPLSRLIAALVGEGLDVVSLVSSKIGEKPVCALQCEVGGLRDVDLCNLQEKLVDAMQSSD
ncbi:transcription factor bHLH120-like [Magnolia sinica]|uniref:transcription factor bHLH120-like n=1 Tax=Magnolia sinica TaxID=86752 RepID=UPI00265A39E8|nr:transcription factor bHLH120-like [Magnolia sinica]